MKIGELAARAGLSTSAIRYYEKIGLLAAPMRVGRQRRYSDESLHRALLIRFARDMGFSLSEIKVFLNGLREKGAVGPGWRRLAYRKIAEVEETINRSRRLKVLLQHLLRCQCSSAQMCVQRLSLSPKLRGMRREANDQRTR